jgi:GntP family gluconate:H+ symporter
VRPRRDSLKYIRACAAGGAATHTLVPPTPGPLAFAGTLGGDLGTMVMMGTLVAVPAAAVGLLYAGWTNRRMPEPMRAAADGVPPADAPGETRPLPGLLVSVLPIVLPVLLISANTLVGSMIADPGTGGLSGLWPALAPYTAIAGNANLALLLAAAIAMWVYVRQRRATRVEVEQMVEASLMSAGVIILITAAGGAFGAMLQAAQIGPAIQSMFAGGGAAGLLFLLLAFAVSSLIKVAQGSSTVAMITTAGMLSAMIAGEGGSGGPLPFHPVYVATAIASGALVGTWMNDSGFWIFSKMGGLTETETLRTWTPLLAVVGVTAMAATVALALLLPLR